MDPVRIIHDESGYKAAMAEYEGFFDVEPMAGSPEADRFELLGLVLARYEAEQVAIDVADPIEVIRVAMEARGLTQADLAALFGSRPRASEVLNRKRDLTLDQVRRLHREWRIPAESLLGAA